MSEIKVTITKEEIEDAVLKARKQIIEEYAKEYGIGVEEMTEIVDNMPIEWGEDDMHKQWPQFQVEGNETK